MKKGLRWIISGLVLASTFTVAACGGEEVEEHKHTYAATWTSNEAGHWYAATCEHTDQMANMATHEDEENDGVCDVCGYGEDHEHTWDTENWTSDTTSHWHAVSCGHSVEVKDQTAHTDASDDGVCDVCEGLTYDATHVHEWATEYQADLTHHWNLGACETTDGKICHTGVIGNKEKHTDDDKDGVCDVCENKTYDETVHTHAAASGAAWVYDNTNHWKVCADHAGVKVELASHNDANNDKICDGCGFDYNHTHTYNTSVWAGDENYHWHAVTCGCSIAVVDKAAHTDDNDDGVCDVCGKNTFAASHTHAAASGAAWNKDVSGHWMVCAEHAGVKVNVGNHVDANNDGICETCEYDVHGGAGHSFASVYSYNETNHWYASSCGHNVKKGEEAHVDANNDKECDVCGRVDGTHEHAYDTSAWKQSATTHYYEATCGCSLKALEEDHKDKNNDGLCDVCEYVLYAEDHVHADNATAEWEKDADNHWKRCIAHSGVIVLEAAHVDENDDGICDVCTYADAEHEHTFVNVWSYDETNHWHVGECHSGVTNTAEAHVDENNNGVCDVCEWNYGHEHTYEAEYTTNENQHWYEVTCGHNVEEREDHYDVDDDGICDACEYVLYAEDHVHTAGEFAEIFSDATYHWYVCEDHSGAKVNVEAHVDEDGNIACDVCEMHVLASIIDFIETEAMDKVNMGQVTYVTPWHEPGTETNLFYEIGVDYFHTYDWVGVEDEWFYTKVNGELFVLINDVNEGLKKPYDYQLEGLNLNNLKGYQIKPFDYSDLVGYGVEDMIITLYNEAVATDTLVINFTPIYEFDYDLWEDVVVGYEYGFSGTHVDNNDNVCNFTVSFTGSEGGFVENFTLTVNAAYGDSVYTFMQRAGVRSAVSPYSAADLIPTSLELQNGYGVMVEDGETIQMTMGESLYWTIVNVAPDSAKLNFDTFSYTCLDSEGNDAEGMINVYLEGESLSVSHGYLPVAGTYTVTMSWTNVEYTFTFVLNSPEVTYISAKVYDNAYYSYVEASMADIFVGETIDFVAGVDEYADKAYTASITSNNGATAELTSEDHDYYYKKYYFTATAVGEYVVTLVSAENSEITATLTITVSEPPTVEDILNGSYFYYDEYDSGYTAYVTFTPASEDTVTGAAEITIVDRDGEKTVYKVNYAYNETDGVVLTNKDGSDFSDVVMSYDNTTYTLSVSFTALVNTFSFEIYDWVEEEQTIIGTLSPYTPPTLADQIAGEYRYYTGTADPRYALVLNADGTGEFALATYDSVNWSWNALESATFTWSVEENDSGAYVITISDVTGSTMLTAGAYTMGTVMDYYEEETHGICNVAMTIDGTSTTLNYYCYELYN